MKLVYAPSGKRMIPYPPVGIALLAGSLMEAEVTDAQLCDLEMLLWTRQQKEGGILLYHVPLNTQAILRGETSAEIDEYQNLLFRMSGTREGEDLGISVMGFEQLASALLLARAALRHQCRVILGGQFWCEQSAHEALSQMATPNLTIAVGDGWETIRDWVSYRDRVPVNGFAWRDGNVAKGDFASRRSQPPIPNYDSVDWEPYGDYAQIIYADDRPIKRAHLYVWDKLCPFKCNFCRVSSGSNAMLNPPSNLVQSLSSLLRLGVRQFNFMTNELNPSLKYMRRVTDALRSIVESYPDIGWFTYLRPDYMEYKDLINLRQIGCRLVRYGVETGSQRLSDMMEKGYRVDTVSTVLRFSADADIMNHVNFIVGYPGETEQDVDETVDFITRNKSVIHSVRINPFYLAPGTSLSRNPEKYNLRLTSFQTGYWRFEMIGKEKPEVEVIERRIDRIVSHLKDLGIGFAGVLPFNLLNTLNRFSDRDTAIEELRRTHSYLWEESSPDALKSQLGKYSVNAAWKSTIYKRGRNYNLDFCTD